MTPAGKWRCCQGQFVGWDSVHLSKLPVCQASGQSFLGVSAASSSGGGRVWGKSQIRQCPPLGKCFLSETLAIWSPSPVPRLCDLEQMTPSAGLTL